MGWRCFLFTLVRDFMKHLLCHTSITSQSLGTFAVSEQQKELEKLTWEIKQVISISRFAWRGHSSSYQTLLGEGGEKKTPQVKDYSSTLCKTVNWISNGSLLRLNDWRKSSYNLRGINILTLPKVNGTTYEQRSWRYKAAQLWNTLPLNLRAVTSYKYFETIISQIDLSRMYVFNLWACL